MPYPPGDLLSRLVACHLWRWAPGLRNQHGDICVQVGDDGLPTLWVTTEGEVIPAESMPEGFYPYPELDSPALSGHLQDLVMAAFRDDATAALIAALGTTGPIERKVVEDQGMGAMSAWTGWTIGEELPGNEVALYRRARRDG